MKFAVSRESFLRPLQLVIGAVERRQTLPALGNVLIRAGERRVELTATDLEIELVAGMDMEVESAGEITVPARKLFDIVKALPEGVQTSLSTEGERATLRAGRSRFTLSTLAAGDFPSLDDFQGPMAFRVAQSDLKDLIERTAFAMAQQDVRYYLNGLLVELTGEKLRAVATDGHRLAVCDIAIPDSPIENRQVIVPRKGVLELGRLLDAGGEAASVELGTNHLRVTLPDVRFTSKLIDGRFPDYQRVMPARSDRSLTADRLTLKEALTRAAILSNEKYRGIRLTMDGDSLSIEANNPDQEEAQEEIPVSYLGERLEVGFNVNYLLDVLGVIDGEQVKISLQDANSSCLVEDEQSARCQYVVMPMRL